MVWLFLTFAFASNIAIHIPLVKSLCTILQFGNLKLAAVILGPHLPFLLLPFAESPVWFVMRVVKGMLL